MALSISNVPVKKQCPYMEKCYRRNPIHFNEMLHPHLENIIMNQLEGEICLPENLEFECSDRSLLIDQLKIMQMVLRKQRNKGESGSSAKEPNSKISNTNATRNSENFKDRVEKHKQAMIQKREEKLKDMDQEAEALFNCSKNKIAKMRSEVDDVKRLFDESTQEHFHQDRKRGSKGSVRPNESDEKKAKSSDAKYNAGESSRNTNESANSTQGSRSSMKPSIIEAFESCNSMKLRNDIREKAIKMLKHQGFEVSLVEPGNFDMKYALSAPYHLFLTRIHKSKETYNQDYSITFPEILDVSLGEIVCSLHINFMVDVGWLCLQYLLAGQRTDMYIIYGERVDEEKLSSNITMLPVEMPSKFGCHHTKIMILKYKNDGIRIVVSTANLYADDWENRTQGLWISPHLPPLPESANPGDGESPTGFKKDFQRYLNRYRQPAITEMVSAVRRADFSAINVFFLASVPGRHTGVELECWGHKKLGSILSKHATLPSDSPRWTLVAQSSSIGSLGPNYESWLQKDITSSMSKEHPTSLKSQPNFKFIYPSLNDYKQSFDCRVGSCCLPYGLQTHSKQEWIENYMCQWKATRTGRSKAMPHIKSYTRLSPDLKRIPWFVLTSANLSKAAWGTVGKDSHYIMNYEAGVVFIPKFITGKSTFPIQEEDEGVPAFPIPYDLPLTPYESGDKPFVTEYFAS